jgi:glycosyltransferase involved in cell wall biosynthesis
MKLFIPLIDNGGGSLRTGFAMSLFMAMIESRTLEYRMERFSDSAISRARNRAAASFLETDGDYLLFLDADLFFEPEALTFINETDEPIVCGMYCLKMPGMIPCLNAYPESAGQMIEDGLTPVRRAGTGFMRIKREVFEAMKAVCPAYTNHGRTEWDFFPFGVRNGEYLSEDWAFCDTARDLGYKVQLDGRIKLRHEGSCLYPMDHEIEAVNKRDNEL